MMEWWKLNFITIFLVTLSILPRLQSPLARVWRVRALDTASHCSSVSSLAWDAKDGTEDIKVGLGAVHILYHTFLGSLTPLGGYVIL